jgi:hypothetical protein
LQPLADPPRQDRLEGYDTMIALLERGQQLHPISAARVYLANVVSDKGRYYLRQNDARAALPWIEKAIRVDEDCDNA